METNSRQLSDEERAHLLEELDNDPVVNERVMEVAIKLLNLATNPDDIAERHSQIQLSQGYIESDTE